MSHTPNLRKGKEWSEADGSGKGGLVLSDIKGEDGTRLWGKSKTCTISTAFKEQSPKNTGDGKESG